eukprot:370642-Amphidinium_carterae.1
MRYSSMDLALRSNSKHFRMNAGGTASQIAMVSGFGGRTRRVKLTSGWQEDVPDGLLDGRIRRCFGSQGSCGSSADRKAYHSGAKYLANQIRRYVSISFKTRKNQEL